MPPGSIQVQRHSCRFRGASLFNATADSEVPLHGFNATADSEVPLQVRRHWFNATADSEVPHCFNAIADSGSMPLQFLRCHCNGGGNGSMSLQILRHLLLFYTNVCVSVLSSVKHLPCVLLMIDVAYAGSFHVLYAMLDVAS